MLGLSVSHQYPCLRSATWLVLLLAVLTGTCSARDKKDVIQFANGDRITCEIIKLEKGYLYVKLSYADGTVLIDWSKVAHIESPQGFVIADKSTKRYTGTLQSTAEGNSSAELTVQVTGPITKETVPANEVVELERTDTSFWQNLHGSTDVGFNYTKQENRTQVNVNSSVVFSRTKWSLGGDLQSSFSGGGDVSNLRNDVLFTGTRQLRSPRNFYTGTEEFLHSNEQELDLRITTGGALGHVFNKTNNSYIGAYSGAVWNRERYSSVETAGQVGNSVEAILGTQMNFFRFKTMDLLLNARVYPSLTDLGRVRFDMNTSLKLRIAKDLYWRIGYNMNVDSRPPQNLPKTDFVSTASLGWTF
jgi:hypothetical protein